MGNSTIKFSFLVVFCMLNTYLKAQVTIGNSERPAEGALLQLKNISGVINQDANATKGLLLPRVNLESQVDLYPMYNDKKEYYETNKIDVDKQHIGLIVYNLKDMRIPDSHCDPIRLDKEDQLIPGPVIWNGEKWENLVEDEFKEEIWPNIFILKDHEGNNYTYSKFGDAGYWMTSSLATKTPPPNINGPTYFLWDSPKNATENTKQAFYGFSRKGLNVSIKSDEDFLTNPNVGLLYSRGAVYAGQTIGENMQGICPEGWHIPSVSEYNELFAEIRKERTKYTIDTLGTAMTTQLITTDCSLFAQTIKGAVSYPAFKGGFSFIMSAWADSYKGEVENNVILELATVQGNEPYFMAGSFTNPSLFNIVPKIWDEYQMLTVRCKKD